MHHLYYIGSRELYTGDCAYPKQWSRTTEAIQLSPQQVRHNCMQSCAFNKYHVSFPDHPTWNEVPGYSARYVPVVYGYHGYGGWREAEGIPCPSKESLPPAMYDHFLPTLRCKKEHTSSCSIRRSVHYTHAPTPGPHPSIIFCKTPCKVQRQMYRPGKELVLTIIMQTSFACIWHLAYCG